jgi:hypothetical protein
MKSEDSFFEWKVTKEKEKRSIDWYWGLGLLGVFGSAAAFLFGNFLFGVFIIVAAIVLFITAKQDRGAGSYKITDKGIVIDDTLFRYKTIDSFWIEQHHDDGPVLLIHTSRTLDPIEVIPLSQEISIKEIHGFLENIITESPLEETRFHRLLDRIGL